MRPIRGRGGALLPLLFTPLEGMDGELGGRSMVGVEVLLCCAPHFPQEVSQKGKKEKKKCSEEWGEIGRTREEEEPLTDLVTTGYERKKSNPHT